MPKRSISFGRVFIFVRSKRRSSVFTGPSHVQTWEQKKRGHSKFLGLTLGFEPTRNTRGRGIESTVALMARGDFTRWLYRGQRPNWIARILNRASAAVASSGVASNYLVALEVTGRKSGRTFSLPMVMAAPGNGTAAPKRQRVKFLIERNSPSIQYGRFGSRPVTATSIQPTTRLAHFSQLGSI